MTEINQHPPTLPSSHESESVAAGHAATGHAGGVVTLEAGGVVTLEAGGVVTLEDVRHVAALASLELSAEELPGMRRDLNAILRHVTALNHLDTTGVPAMAQVGQMLENQPLQDQPPQDQPYPDQSFGDKPLNHAPLEVQWPMNQPSGGGEGLRMDEVRPSTDRSAVLAAAPETDGRFFKVPKVIER